MSEIKKITEEELLDAVEGTYTNEETIRWHGLDLVIKRNISLTEAIQFVNSVVSVAFDESDSTYQPEKVDFAIRAATVILYTNLTLPADISKAYEIVYQSNLLPTIVGMYIDREQFDIIVQAINDKIDSILEVNAAKINQQVDELSNQFNLLNKELSNFMGSLDMSEVQDFVKLFDDGSIDEEKIVKAVMKNNE